MRSTLLSVLAATVLSVVAVPTRAQEADPAVVSDGDALLAPYRAQAEARWNKDIEKFDLENAEMTPNPDAILFIGSSSIRRWSSLSEDVSPYPAIRRGYGGAKFTDMAVMVNRLIQPHRYRAVVMFIGNGITGAENDHTPDQIEQLARYIVDASHRHQPGAPFFLIEITPTEKRFDAWAKIRAVNARLREIALSTPDTYFIPTASHYLWPDGSPRSDLFVEDKLHLNEKGYRQWGRLIRQRLDDVFATMAVAPATDPAAGETVDSVTSVFESGQDGYNVFRIPAVIRTRSNQLLAFCEARQGGDASEIDLVLKRSTDGGTSWGPLQVVQEGEDFRELFGAEAPPITIGNPAPVVDLLDPEHAGRIWLPFTLENDRVFVVYSDDDGKTWSDRREITKDVKKESWGWYATGPVHSIQIRRGKHRGRLVIPTDHRIGGDGKDGGPLGAHAVLSDDHGKTWRLGAIDESYDDGLGANETTVVELADGTLYFNTRDQKGDAPGTRGEAWSSDGGETFDSRSDRWAAFRPAPGILDPPVVQCALLRAGNDLIVFSGPDENGPTGKGRSDLRLRFSTDEAQSWQDGPMIHVGPAAYSDLVMVNDETLGVLFENGDRSGKNAYERISFARVPRSHIRGN